MTFNGQDTIALEYDEYDEYDEETNIAQGQNDSNEEEEEGETQGLAPKKQSKIEKMQLDKKVCGGRCFCTRRRVLTMIAIHIIVAVACIVIFGTPSIFDAIKEVAGKDDDEETSDPAPTPSQPNPTPSPTPAPTPTVDINFLSWPHVGGTSVSVSDDGQSFAVGGDGTSDNFRIFEVDTTNNQQMNIRLFENNQSYAPFATSIALSGDGDRVAVASLFATENQTHVVEVYESGDWSKPLGGSIRITPPDNSSTYYENLSLSFSENGSVIAIGCPRNDGPERGLVYVYQHNTTTETWALRGSALEGVEPGDGFGKSISLSADGDIVAIGAYLSSEYGEKSGSVAIYQYSSTEGWEDMGEKIYGDNEMEQSGYSISLSDEGDIIAIGSPHASSSDNTANIGQVRIYYFNTTESQWVKHGPTILGEVENGMLGSTVSISGNGMHFCTSSKQESKGLVHIYDYVNQTDWMLHAKYNGNSSEFGYSLSLNDNGNVLVVGAPDEQNGTVYYYPELLSS